MRTIDDILKLKGRTVFQVTPDIPILSTFPMIDREDVQILLLIEAGYLVVMASEGDARKKSVLARKLLTVTQLRQIVSRIVILPSDKEDIDDNLAYIQEKGSRHLPIMLDGFLIGKITTNDITRIICADR